MGVTDMLTTENINEIVRDIEHGTSVVVSNRSY